MKYTTTSDKQTFALGKKFASTLRGGEVIALDGELGAGKTVFVKGLAAGLGITATVHSPTFILMKPYAVKKNKSITTLLHIDAYRLKDAAQLEGIGIEDYLEEPTCVTVIEWAQKVQALLPKKYIQMTLKSVAQNKREITIY